MWCTSVLLLLFLGNWSIVSVVKLSFLKINHKASLQIDIRLMQQKKITLKWFDEQRLTALPKGLMDDIKIGIIYSSLSTKCTTLTYKNCSQYINKLRLSPWLIILIYNNVRNRYTNNLVDILFDKLQVIILLQ